LAFNFFPYREYPLLKSDGTTEQHLRPTVDFTIGFGQSSWSEDALIDTGCPLTLITHHVGLALGVDYLRRDATTQHIKILGSTRAVQRERVAINLNRFGDRLAWETDVWFFTEEWDMQLHVGGIFGTAGFLDKWAVTFVRPYEYFVIEEMSSFDLRVPPESTLTIPLDDDQDWWRTGD
jgi:hypothetical protein